MSYNILITGANGQLGREMRNILHNSDEFNIYFTDIDELDITNKDAVKNFVCNHNIGYIVNCAAYTAVDAAEDNKELCESLNHTAVANLAEAALARNAWVIHVSTDYVFSGTSCRPYNECDVVDPKTVYGKTKLDGEFALSSILPEKHIIIRTAWLYSPYGKNFVKTMMSLGASKDSLNVVYDQVGTPTYAGDLAKVIHKIILSENKIPGIYHYSNEGVCSWYDFTKIILCIAGITSCEVYPVSSAEYPSKAVRPAYSVLDKSKIKRTFGIAIPYWIDSLEKCIKILNEQSNNI